MHSLTQRLTCYLYRIDYSFPPSCDKLYASFFSLDHRHIPGDLQFEEIPKAVFQFPMSASDCKRENHYYCRPDCFFLAESEVTALRAFGGDYVVVGNEQGSIEMWECRGGTTPRCISVLRVPLRLDSPPHEQAIANLLSVAGTLHGESLRYGFVSGQYSEFDGTSLHFWQPTALTGTSPKPLRISSEKEPVFLSRSFTFWRSTPSALSMPSALPMKSDHF